MHVTGDKHWIRNMTPIPEGREFVRVANGARLPILGIGDVLFVQQRGDPILIKGVRWAKGMGTSLLSTHDLSFDKNCSVSFQNAEGTVLHKGTAILRAPWQDNGYWLHGAVRATIPMPPETPRIFTSYAVSLQVSPSRLWHQRLGHVGPTRMTDIISHTTGIPHTAAVPPDEPCQGCTMTVRKRDPFPRNPKRATRVLELVHMDIGYGCTTGTSGEKYFIVFVDDYSRRVHVAYLKSRQGTEILASVQRYVAKMQADHAPHRVKEFSSDNEFDFKLLADWCMKMPIAQTFTVPHTPQMNARAERMMQTLKNNARAMLYGAGLPIKFWPFAISAAAYLRNRLPHESLPEHASPYEMCFRRRPDVSHLRVFGCLAYPMLQPDQRESGPWATRSAAGIFLGYSTQTNFGYLVYLPEARRVVVAREVRFAETQFWEWGSDTPRPGDWDALFPPGPSQPDEDQTPAHCSTYDSHFATLLSNITTQMEAQAGITAQPNMDGDDQPDLTNNEEQLTYHTAFLGWHIPDTLANNAMCSLNGRMYLLNKLQERHDWAQWFEAIKEEYDSLESLQALIPVAELPAGKRAIGSKWVLQLKTDALFVPVRHKGRLVVQGQHLRPGCDFYETFSPVVSLPRLRTLFAWATIQDLHISLLDIRTAYLNAKASVEVYIRRPALFDELGARPAPYYRVDRALYGMPSSGRDWFLCFREAMLGWEFQPCAFDDCIFVHRRAIIAVYVDDLFLMAATAEDAEWATQQLGERFKMRKSPTTNAFLGLSLEKAKDSLRIHQRGYILGILEDFKIASRGRGVPMSPDKKQQKNQGDVATLEGRTHYISLLGRVGWVAMVSRPDISFAVSVLCRFSSNPSEEHQEALICIVLYLKRTIDYGLIFIRRRPPPVLDLKTIAYGDADHAGDPDTARSTTGFIILVEGMTVCWKSKLQATTADSSTAAEYIALHHASKEALYTRQVLANISELFYGQHRCLPVTLWTDSNTALRNIRNNTLQSKARLIAVKHHAAKQAIDAGILDIQKVDGKVNPADALTKALSSGQIEAFAKKVGLTAGLPV